MGTGEIRGLRGCRGLKKSLAIQLVLYNTAMKIFKTKEAKAGFSKLLYDTAKIILVIVFLQPIMELRINAFVLTISSLLFIFLSAFAFYLDNKEMK